MVGVYGFLEALSSARKDGLSLGQMAECLIAHAMVTEPEVVVKIAFTWPRKKKASPALKTIAPKSITAPTGPESGPIRKCKVCGEHVSHSKSGLPYAEHRRTKRCKSGAMGKKSK